MMYLKLWLSRRSSALSKVFSVYNLDHSLFDVMLSISGRTYISYPLPRTGQQVEIGERPKLIAKVNLGQLGLGNRVRRWKGQFPRIYVLNYTAHPLQPG